MVGVANYKGKKSITIECNRWKNWSKRL